MRDPLGSERAVDEVGNARRAASLAAGRQHEFSRTNALSAGEGETQSFRLIGDALEPRAVLHRDREDAPQPEEVVHPHDAIDLAEPLPRGGAELRLVPGAEGEGRDAEVGARHVLR